jgi:hypothetical protein
VRTKRRTGARLRAAGVSRRYIAERSPRSHARTKAWAALRSGGTKRAPATNPAPKARAAIASSAARRVPTGVRRRSGTAAFGGRGERPGALVLDMCRRS